MTRKTIRRLLEKSFGSEWEQLVRKIRRREAKRFLILWNRGLGDIALGMCRLVDELRACVVDAHITVLTRADLADAFVLLPVDQVLVDPLLQRRQAKIDVASILTRLGSSTSLYDLILERPDPTYWFHGTPARQPRLRWPARHSAMVERFDARFDGRENPCIDVAVHVKSETDSFYKYRKDWPIASWQALFERCRARHPTRFVRFVLFGLESDDAFKDFDCIDLRGQTSFLEMMALIERRCPILIAPDSGVLTMTYYLDVQLPLGIISLWADPRQGILKQGSASPNARLRHCPILASDERIESISVDMVASALDPMLEEAGRHV